MPSLAKQVGEAFKDPDKLTSRVARHLLVANGTSPGRARAIHPSEVSSEHWCPRATYYHVSGAEAEPVPANLMFEMVYETGHDAHRKWQSWWWDMGILRGMYYCLNCGLTWQGLSPDRCPECEARRPFLRYEEVPIFNEEYGIVGSADGDVLGHGLVEVKTIGSGTVRMEAPNLLAQHTHGKAVDWDSLWRSIRRPFASHRRQGMIYDFCAGRDQMTFIYDPKFVTAYPKEFVVKFKKEYIEDILDECLKVKAALERGRAPKRPMWATKSHRSCQRCPYRSVCYGNNRPHRKAVEGTDRRTGGTGETGTVTQRPPRVRYAKVADELNQSR